MRRSHDLQMGSVQFNTCSYMTVVRLNELEAKLQAPTADPKHLLRLLGNISSATVDAPRDFPLSPCSGLVSKISCAICETVWCLQWCNYFPSIYIYILQTFA